MMKFQSNHITIFCFGIWLYYSVIYQWQKGISFFFFSLRCTINTMCHKLLIVEKTTGLMSKVILTMRNIINYQTAICWERYFYFYAWNIVTSTNNRWQWMAALRVSGRFKTSAVPPHLYMWKFVYLLQPNIKIYILRILFSVHFLRCWWGEIVYQSRTTVNVVGDHFLYSHDLNVRFRSDVVRRIYL